jgi:excinuclease UvrABC nuclease subunit
MCHWQRVPIELADVFLPSAPGVYTVMSAKAGNRNHSGRYTRVIYIGCSQNMQKRWALGHHKLLPCLREGGKEIRYFISEDYKNLEEIMIAKLTPSLNGTASGCY